MYEESYTADEMNELIRQGTIKREDDQEDEGEHPHTYAFHLCFPRNPGDAMPLYYFQLCCFNVGPNGCPIPSRIPHYHTRPSPPSGQAAAGGGRF